MIFFPRAHIKSVRLNVSFNYTKIYLKHVKTFIFVHILCSLKTREDAWRMNYLSV